jgi:SAM-dependent methyltransferase
MMVAEKAALQRFLPGLKGDIAVQYAFAGTPAMLKPCGIEHKFFLQACEHPEKTPEPGLEEDEFQALYIKENSFLPFASSSVDICLLSHMLEFSDEPHQLLRDSKEILVSGGHLVITGFNPYSFWGGRKLFSRSRAPWNGHNMSIYKIRDWLNLLNFQVTGGMMLYYSPVIKNQNLRRRFKFMEDAGDRWWPMLGSVYLLVAQKKEQGMTVIDFRENFKEDSYLNMAEPVVKNYKDMRDMSEIN